MSTSRQHQLWIGAGIALALSVGPARGQYVINTVAGTSGRVAEGRVALDAAGNLYFAGADQYNTHVVLKVAPDGVVSTVAGNGGIGCTGDGGPATEATLAQPYGFAVDNGGNLYIADRGAGAPQGCEWGAVIRKVSPDGTISSPVNQLYTGSCSQPFCNGLYYTSGVAVDGGDNLYIADSGHNRILKGPSSGFGPVDYLPLPWVVAGDRELGSAGYSGDNVPAIGALLNSPMGITVDGAGNFYIADSYNHRIRKVTPGGIITTVAGNGTAGYSGDGGPATAASLNRPWDVAVDGAGNLYIADLDNRRIRKVTPDGVISTIAGNGDWDGPVSGDGGPATDAPLVPYGIAVDGAGRVFVVDIYGAYRRIRVLTLTPTTTTVTSISPEPSVVGQSYTVSFTVSAQTGWPAAGVNVTVSDGSQTCTATLGQGNCVLPSASAGSKSITATYAGDDHFSGSTSAPVTHTVMKANTMTTITSDLSAATVVGQSYRVAFAVVAEAPGSGTPTGNATVSDGSQTCNATVAEGSCLLTSLAAGSKTITANYTGDANFNASVSPAVPHTVTEPLPAAPSNVDAVVVANVNKRSTAYTGTVTWHDNSNNETGFLIRRFSSALGACTVEAGFSAGVEANITAYTDSAANEATCGYGVASINASGTSAFADDTNIISASAPSAPTNVNAVMSTSAKGRDLVYSARITWVNTSASASNFLVRRYAISGSICVLDTGFGSVVLAANKNSYADSKAPAATCAYAVAATNPGGTSAWVGDRDLSGGISPF